MLGDQGLGDDLGGRHASALGHRGAPSSVDFCGSTDESGVRGGPELRPGPYLALLVTPLLRRDLIWQRSHSRRLTPLSLRVEAIFPSTRGTSFASVRGGIEAKWRKTFAYSESRSELDWQMALESRNLLPLRSDCHLHPDRMPPAGLEPAPRGLKGRRSNQLSYRGERPS